MNVEFVDELPPRKSGGSRWVEEANALRARPLQWAVIAIRPTPELARGTARNISVGILRAFRPVGSFEAAARVIDGENRVYARYMGETTDG